MVPAVPAVIEVGKPDTLSWLAAAGLTVTVALAVREDEAVSLTVMVSAPALFKVTVKVCTPASAAVKV